MEVVDRLEGSLGAGAGSEARGPSEGEGEGTGEEAVSRQLPRLAEKLKTSRRESVNRSEVYSREYVHA